MGTKKMERKRQARIDRPYTFTPAQMQMRDDVLRKGIMGADKEPELLGDIIREQLGLKQQDPAVREVALELIHESDLTLSLKQWAVVQDLVERAVLAGIQIGRDLPG